MDTTARDIEEPREDLRVPRRGAVTRDLEVEIRAGRIGFDAYIAADSRDIGYSLSLIHI